VSKVVDCATWLEVVKTHQLETACNTCPPKQIDHCKTQVDDVCEECIQG